MSQIEKPQKMTAASPTLYYLGSERVDLTAQVVNELRYGGLAAKTAHDQDHLHHLT